MDESGNFIITAKERFKVFAKDGGSSEKRSRVDFVVKVWALSQTARLESRPHPIEAA